MEDMPRRNCLDKCTPAELAIYKAIEEIEKIDASDKIELAPLLTNAVCKLNDVREIVADFIDNKADKLAIGDIVNEAYDNINPQHYKNYSVESIDMMIRIYGAEYTAMFCEMNAFKYRMRMGTKSVNNIEQDLAKEAWYLNKAKELRTNNEK